MLYPLSYGRSPRRGVDDARRRPPVLDDGDAAILFVNQRIEIAGRGLDGLAPSVFALGVGGDGRALAFLDALRERLGLGVLQNPLVDHLADERLRLALQLGDARLEALGVVLGGLARDNLKPALQRLDIERLQLGRALRLPALRRRRAVERAFGREGNHLKDVAPGDPDDAVAALHGGQRRPNRLPLLLIGLAL